MTNQATPLRELGNILTKLGFLDLESSEKKSILHGDKSKEPPA
jgi:hypothetical protein